MKIVHTFKKTLLAASITASMGALVACGGSGTDTASVDQLQNGKITGVITGFGSIYVNGVEFETDSASLSIDGVTSQETSLGVGDVIVLEGTINADGTTGVATAVVCNDELEGMVLDVSGLGLDGTGTLNVMGQTVTVTADTVFDSDTLLSINDLSVQDIVEVSGFPDGTGTILATRIETKDASEDIEVKGKIASLDTATQTFSLGNLSVDYSSASELPADLADGLFVEVKTESALTGDLTSGFTLVASKVEAEDNDSEAKGDEGDEIEIQGVVTNINDTGFDFNGVRVEFDSLDLDDDFDMTTLAEGSLITAEGTIDADGNFVIEEIEDKAESEDEADGTVTEITEDTVTISLSDQTTMLFSVNNDTRMIDEQDEGVEPLHYFSLADVGVGEFLEVEYYTDESGNFIATEIVRDDAE